MSAAVQARGPDLVLADRQIIARASPHIAAVLSGLSLDDLAVFVAKDEDLSGMLPAYQDVPGFARGVLKGRLGAAGDAFFESLLEATRTALRPTHPDHAALLGRPKGAAWYRANVERLRDKILSQLGA